MKRKRQSKASRDIGLEIGWICGRYFLKMDYLHYGYWTKDLAVDLANLAAAQASYVEFVAAHIPAGVRTILDVGCGTGQMAKDLQERGYRVDCISPNAYFAERTRRLMGDSGRVFETTYEEFVPENRYDLVLFAESFQYVGAPNAISKTWGLLDEGGYMLICDFFALPIPEKSPIGGGESWGRFSEVVASYSLEPLLDVDITAATAPTVDLIQDAFDKAIQPAAVLGVQLLADRHPVLYKLIKWAYRHKIEKINRKYFSGQKSGENFGRFKSYRLLLYRKRAGNASLEGSD